MSNIEIEKGSSYEHDRENEDCERLLPDHEEASLDLRPLRQTSRHWSWLAIATAFLGTAILSACLGAWIAQRERLDADAFCIRHTSQYSPIIKDVGVTYNQIQFNGSLLVSNAYRLDAGPEVDAAWKELGVDYHAARVPNEEAGKSGLASDQVKIKEEYGGGYPAHVEGLHHLHCLNLLRKSLSWNFEYYQKQGLGPFSNDANILKHHVTHCLDILRQQLMCTVDNGVLGQVWYQPPDKPLQAFVDFNTVHTCRNFDAIRNWAEKHQLPAAEDTPPDFLQLPEKGDRIYHDVP